MLSWVEAFNQNDSEHITSFYEDDERVDLLVSMGKWMRGSTAIADMYASDMQAVEFYDSKAEKMNIRVFDNTALISFEHRFKYNIVADDTHWKIHIRTTVTLRNTENGWKIVQEHSSPIHGVERAIHIK